MENNGEESSYPVAGEITPTPDPTDASVSQKDSNFQTLDLAG